MILLRKYEDLSFEEIGQRLGRSADARAAYDRAIGLAGNAAETAYLTRRRDQLA